MKFMQTVANINNSITDFCCKLSNLGVIQFSGEEAGKYLQGQVTADINALNDQHALLGCHCDFKGKTWNIGYFVGTQTDVLMLCSKGAIPGSLPELKKYGVFAKTDIDDVSADYSVFGGNGSAFEAALNGVFDELPGDHLQVVRSTNGVVIRFKGESDRYLAVLYQQAASRFAENYKSEYAAEDIWEALDIRDGIANIQEATSNEFVPQMMNMQSLDAISFEKGCYMGQEVVARTKFLGKNKRAAFILKTEQNAEAEAGDLLEMQIGENWRRGGTVLRSASLEEQSWILAIMANDTSPGDVLRLKESPEIQYEVQKLPYELGE